LRSDGQTLISLFVSLARNTVSNLIAAKNRSKKTNETMWLKDRFNCEQCVEHDYHYTLKGYLKKIQKNVAKNVKF